MDSNPEDLFLWWGSGSPPCWRAMIVLAEKGLNYGSKLITFSEKEHKSPEILKYNPRGQVPTFRHGEVAINESAAICDYLEQTFKSKGTQLVPEGNAEKALVLQRQHEAAVLHKKGVEDVVFIMFSPSPDQEKLKKNKESLSAELKIWDGYAKQTGAYIAGKKFTMADAMFFPSFAFLVRMGLQLNPKYPHLARYYEDTRKRESIQKTWPPHWKTSEGKDMLKDV